MKQPFNRIQLGQLAVKQAEDAALAFAQESPARRLAIALALMQTTRKLAMAASADWIASPRYDLAEKSTCYISPLRRAMSASRVVSKDGA